MKLLIDSRGIQHASIPRLSSSSSSPSSSYKSILTSPCRCNHTTMIIIAFLFLVFFSFRRVSLTLSCPMNLKLFPLDWQTCSLAMASCKFKCTNYLNYLTKHSTNDLCTALNESLYKKKKQIVKTRDIVAISTEELINVLVLHIFSLFLLSLLFFFFFHLRVVNFSFFFFFFGGVPFVRWLCV